MIKTGNKFSRSRNDLVLSPLMAYERFSLKALELSEIISHNSPKMMTGAEEIYQEEEKDFFQRFSVQSLSPLQKGPIFPISRSVNKKKIINLTPVPHSNSPWSKSPYLPPISKKNLQIPKPAPQLLPNSPHKRHSIRKVMQVYDQQMQIFENTKSLKNCINRNSVMAKQYTKEMNWASERIHELNGFGKDVMKKIFNELKSSKEMYEKEKTEAVNEYNSKFVKKNTQRLSGNKSLKSRFKNRILP